jgi:hypothetical protein
MVGVRGDSSPAEPCFCEEWSLKSIYIGINEGGIGNDVAVANALTGGGARYTLPQIRGYDQR